MKRTSVLLPLSLGFLMTTAAFAIQSTPSSISYYDSKGVQHIYAFAVGDNHHLVVNYSDGYGWYWRDQGLPAPSYSKMDAGTQPAAITYMSGGKQLIYVFAVAYLDGYPHLVVNYWDGSNWRWADQNAPAGYIDVDVGLTAITYASASSGQQMIDVLVHAVKASDSSSYLLINSWDGSNWTWAEHPVPASMGEFFPYTAITYPQLFNQRKYVFGTANGHLIVHYTLDGINWSWADQNQNLPNGVSSVNSPTAITFASGGEQLIYVFATANTGDLVVNYWTGSGWYWRDSGLPPSPVGTTGVYNPTAITYASGGRQLIYVFAGASNASGPTSLVVSYWDGFNWYWADQGIPSQITWECGGDYGLGVLRTNSVRADFAFR